jgi:hypothetical protein
MKGMSHFRETIVHVDNLLEMFNAEYTKDGNAKDAAIDSVVEILQAHKTTAEKK